MAQRKSPSSLARFLMVRGLWLIVLEVLVVSTAASFALLGIAELAAAPTLACRSSGPSAPAWRALAGRTVSWVPRNAPPRVAIIFGHNLLDGIWPAANYSHHAATSVAVLHARQVY